MRPIVTGLGALPGGSANAAPLNMSPQSSGAAFQSKRLVLLSCLFTAPEPLSDQRAHHFLELLGDIRSPQSRCLLSVDEDRRGRRLARAGKRNTYVGVLRFAGSVDDASHHGHFQLPDARISFAPQGHVFPDI